MSKLYDLIYQGTIIHNNIDAFAVARETVAELISLAQKGVLVTSDPVSYTHLDVYKRQDQHSPQQKTAAVAFGKIQVQPFFLLGREGVFA